MTKTRQDNNVTNHTSPLYAENKIELYDRSDKVRDGKNLDLSVSQAWIRLETCITILGVF